MIAVSRLPLPAIEPRSWLSHHRAECLLVMIASTVFVSIWWNLQHAGPRRQDIVDAVDRYIVQLHADDAMKTGSLRREMRNAVLAPHLRDLQISDRQHFPGYWAIDARMQLERPLALPLDLPVRLRVARKNDDWVVIDAEDISGYAIPSKETLRSK